MISKLLKPAEKFIADNTPLLLTGVGVVGTVGTAVLTGKATVKAVRLYDETQEKSLEVVEAIANDRGIEVVEPEPLSTKDTLLLCGPQYLPAVGCGVATILAIVFAHRVSAKEAAALAAAYGISDKAFSDYRAKIEEKLGVNKEQKVRDELAQDRVNASPPPGGVIVASGEVMFLDLLSGRYFKSTVETVNKAVNTINHEILNHHYASLGMFYEEIGLPSTMLSDELGWNTDLLLDIRMSTTLTPDNQPCITLDFIVAPKANYQMGMYR